ncbi:MAG: (2Fe-2S)-binding protein [Proteobacteria bacterium]|nr:(2Fe-2S)-binding protein [Pseudomonadota bacterium]
MSEAPLLQRLPGLAARRLLDFTLDGRPAQGFEGDTVLTAVLVHQARVRDSDAGASPRSGFCAIGACQDCWVDAADGSRFRACTTPLQAGMALLTTRRGP